LIITEEQIQQALGIIREAIEELPHLNEEKNGHNGVDN